MYTQVSEMYFLQTIQFTHSFLPINHNNIQQFKHSWGLFRPPLPLLILYSCHPNIGFTVNSNGDFPMIFQRTCIISAPVKIPTFAWCITPRRANEKRCVPRRRTYLHAITSLLVIMQPFSSITTNRKAVIQLLILANKNQLNSDIRYQFTLREP